MVEKELKCSSCNKRITNEPTARFICPKCSKQEIIRCVHCKSIAAKYKCPECEFEGP